jgi:hypothetical protein
VRWVRLPRVVWEGHLHLTAFDGAGNIPYGCDIDNQLFARATKSDNPWDDQDGIAWPPGFEVEFLADQGQIYKVYISATISGDQSGMHTILAVYPSWSDFYCGIEVQVPFITVEVTPH